MSSTALWLVLASVAFASAVSIVVAAILVQNRRDGDWEERQPPTARRAEAATELPAAEVPATGRNETARLRQAVEQARQDAFRARKLAALTAIIDLDELIAQLLATAVELCTADAAAVALTQEDGPPIISTYGLSADEAPPSLEGLAGQSRARAVAVDYRYESSEDVLGEDRVKRGLLVPVRAHDGSAVGALGVYWRAATREPNASDLSALQELADAALRAIENARRLKEAHELADLDPLTGLYNHRFFHDALAREVRRADRYNRRLALLTFDLDGFKEINSRFGHLGGDAVLSEVARRLREVIRASDFACRTGGDEFAVILPESNLLDARQLYERLRRALKAAPLGPLEGVEASAGAAELRGDDDARAVYRRADEGLLRAKRSGKDQVVSLDLREGEAR